MKKYCYLQRCKKCSFIFPTKHKYNLTGSETLTLCTLHVENYTVIRIVRLKGNLMHHISNCCKDDAG